MCIQSASKVKLWLVKTSINMTSSKILQFIFIILFFFVMCFMPLLSVGFE